MESSVATFEKEAAPGPKGQPAPQIAMAISCAEEARFAEDVGRWTVEAGGEEGRMREKITELLFQK
jgi:hypothetical protein